MVEGLTPSGEFTMRDKEGKEVTMEEYETGSVPLIHRKPDTAEKKPEEAPKKES